MSRINDEQQQLLQQQMLQQQLMQQQQQQGYQVLGPVQNENKIISYIKNNKMLIIVLLLIIIGLVWWFYFRNKTDNKNTLDQLSEKNIGRRVNVDIDRRFDR